MWMERQSKDTVGCSVANFAIGFDGSRSFDRIFPARSYNPFTDAVVIVPHRMSAIGLLRRKSLVSVLVAIQDNLRSRLIKLLPEPFHVDTVAVKLRRIARVMPIRERAVVWMRS